MNGKARPTSKIPFTPSAGLYGNTAELFRYKKKTPKEAKPPTIHNITPKTFAIFLNFRQSYIIKAYSK